MLVSTVCCCDSRLDCGSPRHRQDSAAKSRFCRRFLAIENLETRYALSSVSAESLDSCVATAQEEAAVESPLAPVESSDSVSVESADAEFVGPLEADAYFEAISATEPPSLTAEGEGEVQNAPPILLTFTVYRAGPYWVLWGRVADDMYCGNCRVSFDGILEGQGTGVMPDGSFAYYVPYIPGIYEVVNAVAKDNAGNESNALSVVLSN